MPRNTFTSIFPQLFLLKSHHLKLSIILTTEHRYLYGVANVIINWNGITHLCSKHVKNQKNTTKFVDPPTDLPLLKVIVSEGLSSANIDGNFKGAFRKGLLANMLNKCFSARGNCNQKQASKVSPNTAAAKENLAAQPLLITVAYCRTLSSSSKQPDPIKHKRENKKGS